MLIPLIRVVFFLLTQPKSSGELNKPGQKAHDGQNAAKLTVRDDLTQSDASCWGDGNCAMLIFASSMFLVVYVTTGCVLAPQ